jgi:hypothetical protein
MVDAINTLKENTEGYSNYLENVTDDGEYDTEVIGIDEWVKEQANLEAQRTPDEPVDEYDAPETLPPIVGTPVSTTPTIDTSNYGYDTQNGNRVQERTDAGHDFYGDPVIVPAPAVARAPVVPAPAPAIISARAAAAVPIFTPEVPRAFPLDYDRDKFFRDL